MGPGFKYHIVTVSAIFFALTIGLIIGTLYVSPLTVDQSTRTLRRMQETIDRDVVSQRQEIKRYREFVAAVTPELLRGKLSGVSVALVLAGDYAEPLVPIRETLRSAGAQVVSVTTLEAALDRPDSVLQSNLTSLQQEFPHLPSDRAEIMETLATVFVKGDDADDSKMEMLERARLVNRERDSDYQMPAQFVVLLAGSRREPTARPANVDKPFIAALQKQKATVLACEPEGVLLSDFPAYRSLDLDVQTVSSVDSDIGLCNLILVLSAKSKESKNGSIAGAN